MKIAIDQSRSFDASRAMRYGSGMSDARVDFLEATRAAFLAEKQKVAVREDSFASDAEQEEEE